MSNSSGHTLSSVFRRNIFVNQDGMILCLLVNACFEGDLFDSTMSHFIREGDETPKRSNRYRADTVSEIASVCNANQAYLGIALRCFAQQGWFTRRKTDCGTDWIYQMTDLFYEMNRDKLEMYRRIGNFLTRALPFEKNLFGPESGTELRLEFEHMVRLAQTEWISKTNEETFNHWIGAVVVPLILSVFQSGKIKHSVVSWESLAPGVLQLLSVAGWFDLEKQELTPMGELGRGHALYLGMMCSYIPMLVRLPEIIFGDSSIRTHVEAGQTERHVDRKLNILASGAAHAKYFANLDEIVVGIFNQRPIENQPRFIMDVGCGDGSWLKHIYQVIVSQTRRGKLLDQYPLLVVGVEYNVLCQDVCMQLWQEAGVPALFMIGDITDPSDIATKLERFGLQMNQGLHIRSFIDHNRVFIPPTTAPNQLALLPSGAYASENGEPISPSILQRNLVEFLSKWKEFADPHGLVILEGHCVDPEITRWHLSDTHNLVFDTYHGFSHQYPVDFDVFVEAASEAGLFPVIHEQQRYPSRKPFVAISANRFTSLAEIDFQLMASVADPVCQDHDGKQWMPISAGNSMQDCNEDGTRLHELLYYSGDLQRPRPWAYAATGQLLKGIIKHIGFLLDQIENGQRDERQICLADYGAGTGMATIELLRACQSTGIFRRCQEIGATLRICLLDLPSAWFAKSYELLKACPLVEFYAIRDDVTGNFVALDTLVGVQKMDIVMASMVFHLIPEQALKHVFRELANILAPSGLLVWNSPDIGPNSSDAVLFHTANRRLRQLILKVLGCPEMLLTTNWATAEPERARSAYQVVCQRDKIPDSEQSALIARLANSQILPSPNQLQNIVALASPYFHNRSTFGASFEMRCDEVIDTLLVPANQRYIGEITDRELRETLISGLLQHDVIPDVRHGRANTRLGYAVHWTFGEFVRSS